MKCTTFASWLLFLTSAQCQQLRSSLRSERPEKVRSLQSEDFNHNVVLAGIIHHGAEISTSSLNFVLEMSCVNKVRTHVLGVDDMHILAAMYDRLKEARFPGQFCAPFKVSTQPDFLAQENRINRIQAARDFQRSAIRENFEFAERDHATIILADLDVNELPPRDQVVSSADKMNSRTGMDVDVLCSAGKMLNPNGYYDTFATILLPDTFVYPIGGRPDLKARPEEDLSLIIGENFNAEQLMEWFQIKGGANADPVPVKSCFGGLAIYRASKWLDQRCSYKDLQPEVNAKYANRYDEAPCEHVVLHNCLQALDPSVVIAVQPDMHTLWHTSAGPQYAVANYPDLVANFLFDHMDPARSYRHLQVSSNSTDSNITFVNNTNSTFDTTTTSTRSEIPQWIIDLIFDSPIFDVNCTVANATNSSGIANFTATNCTAITPARRMEKINEVVRLLHCDSANMTMNSTNMTMNSTNMTMNSTNVTITSNRTSPINELIYWLYQSNFTNSTNSTNSTRYLELEPEPEQETEQQFYVRPKIHFVIAGFPKCGSSSLLQVFDNNMETSVSSNEQCAMADSSLSDQEALDTLDNELSMLSQDPSVKLGLKCPIGISNSRSLDRIDLHSPNANLLIGVRHPIEYFQSYYNQRITEIYDQKLPTDSIPPVESLFGNNEWNGVSTDSARFELYLMQLGKTEMSVDDFEDMVGRPHLAVKPNDFKIFLYTMAQMEDNIGERKESFQQQLRSFLGLEKPMDVLRQENNNFVGDFAHKESIDICDSKYDAMRALLVAQGTKTQKWIREEFMASPDVVVANKDHFLSMLDTWSHDPCHQEEEEDDLQSSGSGGFWLYIKSFIAPIFNLFDVFFG